MCDDLHTAVVRIARFLGGRAEALIQNPAALAKIIAESRIDSMKKNQTRWFPGQHMNADFIRKGGSRDWTNYMSKEQSDRLSAIARTRLAETDAASWWMYEMAWDEDELSSNMPEIVVTTDDENDDVEEEYSVSRRNSLLLPPDNLGPYLPERRNSFDSIASSGYGSVWSMAVN